MFERLASRGGGRVSRVSRIEVLRSAFGDDACRGYEYVEFACLVADGLNFEMNLDLPFIKGLEGKLDRASATFEVVLADEIDEFEFDSGDFEEMADWLMERLGERKAGNLAPGVVRPFNHARTIPDDDCVIARFRAFRTSSLDCGRNGAICLAALRTRFSHGSPARAAI